MTEDLYPVPAEWAEKSIINADRYAAMKSSFWAWRRFHG